MREKSTVALSRTIPYRKRNNSSDCCEMAKPGMTSNKDLSTNASVALDKRLAYQTFHHSRPLLMSLALLAEEEFFFLVQAGWRAARETSRQQRG
eukprot:g3656.t1